MFGKLLKASSLNDQKHYACQNMCIIHHVDVDVVWIGPTGTFVLSLLVFIPCFMTAGFSHTVYVAYVLVARMTYQNVTCKIDLHQNWKQFHWFVCILKLCVFPIFPDVPKGWRFVRFHCFLFYAFHLLLLLSHLIFWHAADILRSSLLQEKPKLYRCYRFLTFWAFLPTFKPARYLFMTVKLVK